MKKALKIVGLSLGVLIGLILMVCLGIIINGSCFKTYKNYFPL